MTNEELMREAIRLSEENVNNGGGPFGAVIARDGEIVATGVNRVTASHDPTAHARGLPPSWHVRSQRMRDLFVV